MLSTRPFCILRRLTDEMAASLYKEYLAYAKERQNLDIPLSLPIMTGEILTLGPSNGDATLREDVTGCHSVRTRVLYNLANASVVEPVVENRTSIRTALKTRP